jgi:hypothetical protein
MTIATANKYTKGRKHAVTQPLRAGVQNTNDGEALDGALPSAKEGIRVIPVRGRWQPPRFWKPPEGWKLGDLHKHMKIPLINNWPTKGSRDPAIIRRWAKQYPGCNFGLAMGEGFISVDIDKVSASGSPTRACTQLRER